MYLIISEDGGIRKTEKVTEDDKEASVAGTIDLITVVYPNDPLRFGPKGWELIKEIEE